jgi:hypothetical protein
LEFRDFGGETLCGLHEFDAGDGRIHHSPVLGGATVDPLSRKDEPCGAFAGQLHLRAGTRELRIRAEADFWHPDLDQATHCVAAHNMVMSTIAKTTTI